MTSSSIITSEANNGAETQFSSLLKHNNDEVIIWQEDYWRQMLIEFEQLKLYDLVWLEPIKDAMCLVEFILQQILYPHMNTCQNSTRQGKQLPLDVLDDVLDKLTNITDNSKKLIQLFGKEVGEDESGTIVRLLNRSNQLENVLSKLEEKVNNMKQLSAKDVRLDILLHNFKDVTKDRRLLHDKSSEELMRKMAESIYSCKNGFSLLCTETRQSTMVEFVASTLQQGWDHRNYIHTINKLIHLADQLAIAFDKIKCSRDRLFDNQFPYHLVTIVEMDKEEAPSLDTSKNYSLGQYHWLEAFLKDNELLQQSYKHWKEPRWQKDMIYTFPKEQSTSCTSWFGFDPQYAFDVVLQWDPFNSLSCTEYAEVSVWIFSLTESADYLNINSLQNYVKSVSQSVSSRLKDIFDCLINSNAVLQNVKVIRDNSYARHPSRYFRASSDSSVLSGGRDSVCFSSSSSPYSTSLSPNPTDILSPMFHKRKPDCEIEPSGENIFYRFSEAICNLKQLADKLVRKNCGHALRQAFREAFQDATEQKLLLLGFHQGAREERENLWLMETSALRERRRDWEKAFQVVVYELLPWPKFLCGEIFSDNANELMDVCVYEYVTPCLKPLLKFADAVCCAMPNQYERIFHQLHVHETLSPLSDNICQFPNVGLHKSEPTQILFDGEVKEVLERLEKAILKALADFTSQISDGNSCINEDDVDVHHLTRRTMSYLKELSHQRKSIDSILHRFSSDRRINISDVRIDASDSRKFMLPLFLWLEEKLIETSQRFKDPVAVQVFWINNLDHMIKEVASPQLKIILEERWVLEQNDKITRYLRSYKDSVSAEIKCFQASKGSAEKRLNKFKLFVEERWKVRASWKVPNPIWRHALRNSALNEFEEIWKVRASGKVPNPIRRSALKNSGLNEVVSVHCFEFRDSPLKILKHIRTFWARIVKVNQAKSIEKELEGLKSYILHMFEG